MNATPRMTQGTAQLAQPALSLHGLHVSFGRREVVRGIDLEVAPGECVGIVGESGSGKSVTARALVGLVGEAGVVSMDDFAIAGTDTVHWSARQWRRARGKQIGFVLQDALQSLDPLRSVGREVGDALRIHTRMSGAQRAAEVRRLLDRVGVPDAGNRMRQRPGELSGGLRQRALIAAAIACDPTLVIADEPTTALDATVQARVLTELGALVRAGTGLVLISHDLGVVARLADRVLVMRDGRVVEQGATARILDDPCEEYTRELIRAQPRGVPRFTPLSGLAPEAESPSSGARVAIPGEQDQVAVPAPAVAEPLLAATRLRVAFTRPDRTRLVALDDVSVAVRPGRTLGVVGESGSGKTTLARVLLGLQRPDAGSVRLGERPPDGAGARRQAPMIGAVYQDTLASFDPRWTVARILAESCTGAWPGDGHVRGRRMERHRMIDQLLSDVALSSDVLERRPRNLSGGERQRVAIARALAVRPSVLVCDEPVSALDVTVQAQILDLFDELQQRFGLSYVFISHDLGVIGHMSDDIVVMKDGRIVESGQAHDILHRPTQPYTIELLKASVGAHSSRRC